MSNIIVREINEDRLNAVVGILDEPDYLNWGTTPKPQDVYCGFQAHQEVLEIDYSMCRPYSSIEMSLLGNYTGTTTVCPDA